MDQQGRPLKVGVFINPGERMMNGQTPGWSDIQTMVRIAEDVGFDSVWLPDHLIFQMEQDNPEGFRECMTLLAAIAAVTERVELGSAVHCAGFRNPALFAKMVDTIDDISGGRFILGLGAGYHDPEYEAFGYPTERRYSRFVEAFTIIRKLLSDGYVDFEGEFYAARECELRPRGPRPSGPRIMIGTTGKKMLRLTAEHADEWNGWLPTRTNQPSAIPEMRQMVDAACADVGRDPATLDRSVGVLMSATGVTQAHIARLAAPLHGSTAELCAYLQAFAQQGLDAVQVWAYPNSPAGIAAFGPVLEALDHSKA